LLLFTHWSCLCFFNNFIDVQVTFCFSISYEGPAATENNFEILIKEAM
jgi:hypothetical protein